MENRWHAWNFCDIHGYPIVALIEAIVEAMIEPIIEPIIEIAKIWNSYNIEKLKYSCELINRQQIVATSYEVHFIQEIVHYLEKTAYINEPAIAIYTTILKCLLEAEKEEYFENLKAGKLLFLKKEHKREATQLHKINLYIWLKSAKNIPGAVVSA